MALSAFHTSIYLCRKPLAKNFRQLREILETLIISRSIYFLANEKPKQKSVKICDETTFKWCEKTEIDRQDLNLFKFI
jgi:hypothetical protein